MKNRLQFRMKHLLIWVISLLLASSCVSLKRVRYIQDVASHEMGDSISFKNESSPDYKVQAGDNLYVDVNSLDSKNMNPFEANNRIAYQNNSEMSVYLNSFMVSDSGYINFPVVGRIKVSGLTINEVKDTVQSKVNDFYQLTTVTVKLVNFKISLLGEVVRPGTYMVYQESINIFQALSLAGDLSPYADRSKVVIVRNNGRGSNVYTINLLKSDLLTSPNYYLQPDDIVYIQPLKSKNYAFTSFPYAIIFSTITTTLLILNFFK